MVIEMAKQTKEKDMELSLLERRELLSKEMAQVNYEMFHENNIIMMISGAQIGTMCLQSFMQDFQKFDDGRDDVLFEVCRQYFKSFDNLSIIPGLKDKSCEAKEQLFSNLIMPNVNPNDNIFDLSFRISDKEIKMNNLNANECKVLFMWFFNASYSRISNLKENFLGAHTWRYKESHQWGSADSDTQDLKVITQVFLTAVQKLKYDSSHFNRSRPHKLLLVLEQAFPEMEKFHGIDYLLKEHNDFVDQALASFKLTTKKENVEKFMI